MNVCQAIKRSKHRKGKGTFSLLASPRLMSLLSELKQVKLPKCPPNEASRRRLEGSKDKLIREEGASPRNQGRDWEKVKETGRGGSCESLFYPMWTRRRRGHLIT